MQLPMASRIGQSILVQVYTFDYNNHSNLFLNELKHVMELAHPIPEGDLATQ